MGITQQSLQFQKTNLLSCSQLQWLLSKQLSAHQSCYATRCFSNSKHKYFTPNVTDKMNAIGPSNCSLEFHRQYALAQINTTCSIHPNGCRAAMMTTMPFGLMRTAWYHRAYLETFAAPGGPALPSALLLQQQELLVPNSWAGLTAETKMQITTIITSQCPDSKPSAVSSTLYCLQITWRGLLGY